MKTTLAIEKKIVVLLLYLSAYGLLLLSYYIYIFPTYGYLGFDWTVNSVKVLEALMLTLIISLVLPSKFKKPSDILLQLQFLFPILPMLVLYGAADLSREYIYCTVSAFTVIIIVSNQVKLTALKVVNLSPRILTSILLIIATCFIASIYALGGFRYLNFDFSRVYEFRALAASGLPRVYGYISPMVSAVILPMALLLAVVSRQRIVAGAVIICSVLMFALTNHKAPLFYPFAMLLLYMIMRSRGVIQLLLIGYMGVIFISLAGFMFGGLWDWLGKLFLHRVYFLPANINFQYYDYFSSNPYVLWANSKITLGLLNNPYTTDIPHLIGIEYYSSDKVTANTGWIGSGYMQMGFFGMLIYSLIIGILLALLDAYSKRITKEIIAALVYAPIFILFTSADLPIAFLTNGIILTCILLTLFVLRRYPNQYGNIVHTHRKNISTAIT